jgi:hypothetical protein
MKIILLAGTAIAIAVPALAQDAVPIPVDVGPGVVSLIDIVWTSVLGLIGVVITWAVAMLRPVLQSFLSASVIDMAAARVEAAAKRGVEDVLGDLRKRAAGGDLKINVSSVQVANVVNYLMAQIPTWLKLAGMDRTAVERFVTKMFGQEVAKQEAAITASVATVVNTGAVQDAVTRAVRDAVADPSSPLTIDRGFGPRAS